MFHSFSSAVAEMSCACRLALKWLLFPPLPPSTAGQPVTSQSPDNSLFSNAAWKELRCWQQVAECKKKKTSGKGREHEGRENKGKEDLDGADPSLPRMRTLQCTPAGVSAAFYRGPKAPGFPGKLPARGFVTERAC